MTKLCPRCKSPAPHLHPAMQLDGEVEICKHDFHREVTNRNTEERIRKYGLTPLSKQEQS